MLSRLKTLAYVRIIRNQIFKRKPGMLFKLILFSFLVFLKGILSVNPQSLFLPFAEQSSFLNFLKTVSISALLGLLLQTLMAHFLFFLVK